MLGNAEDIENISLDEIKSFHDKLYNPSNLVLTISGNLPIDKVMKLVKINFGGAWGDDGWQAPEFKPQIRQLGKTVRQKSANHNPMLLSQIPVKLKLKRKMKLPCTFSVVYFLIDLPLTFGKTGTRLYH